MFALTVRFLTFVVVSQGCEDYYEIRADCQDPCLWKDVGCGTVFANGTEQQGCCVNPSCGDPNHNTAQTCTGSVNGAVCVWNPDGDYCQNAACHDYDHMTAETCTGSVNGDDCVWNPNSHQCQSASCMDYNHNSAEKCTGSVGKYDCIWNPTDVPGQSIYCQFASCSGYGHDTVETCNGIVSGDYCLWDEVNNRCKRASCDLEVESKTECNALSGVGCHWIDRGATCQGCRDYVFDCHNFDGDEEGCNDDGPFCGCTWSDDGKCSDSSGGAGSGDTNGSNNSSGGSSGAFCVALPTLLAWILFALLF